MHTHLERSMCRLEFNSWKLGCRRSDQYILAALVLGKTTGGMTNWKKRGRKLSSAAQPMQIDTRHTITSHLPRVSELGWSGLVRNSQW